jgi:hypothetical protein
MHDTYMMSDTFTTCANALLTSCDEASLHAEQALKAAAAAAAKAAAANVITYFAPDPPAKSAQAEAHGVRRPADLAPHASKGCRIRRGEAPGGTEWPVTWG